MCVQIYNDLAGKRLRKEEARSRQMLYYYVVVLYYLASLRYIMFTCYVTYVVLCNASKHADLAMVTQSSSTGAPLNTHSITVKWPIETQSTAHTAPVSLNFVRP